MSRANDNPQFDSSVVGALFRFFNSFERNTSTYCWEWRSTLNTDGYAVMSIADRQHRAYRWFYEHCFGALDEGLTLGGSVMDGDTTAPCRLGFHDVCPWGPCECACHDMPDMAADAAEWDRAEAASLVEAW